MTTCNYLENVKNDVINEIRENYMDIAKEMDRYDFVEMLQDNLFFCNSVTGNASIPYIFNSFETEKNLCGNWILLREALAEFESPMPEYAETADVTIRCCLLGQAIDLALDETGYELQYAG